MDTERLWMRDGSVTLSQRPWRSVDVLAVRGWRPAARFRRYPGDLRPRRWNAATPALPLQLSARNDGHARLRRDILWSLLVDGRRWIRDGTLHQSQCDRPRNR